MERKKRKPCEHCAGAERREGMRYCEVCLKIKRKEARAQAYEMTPIEHKPKYSTMRGEKCRNTRIYGPTHDDHD